MSTTGEVLKAWPDYLDWYIDNRFIRLQNDNLVLLDPVTGQDLSLEAMPECIKQDEICGPGWESLKERSDQGAVVNLVFNFHREQDYEPLESEAGAILLRSKRIGLECNGGPEMGVPLRPSDITWDDIPTTGMGSYIRKTQIFVGEENTVPCDIDYPISPDDKLRHRLGQLLSHARSTVDYKRRQGRENNITANEIQNFHLGWSAYHYMRGYAMIGTLGYMATLSGLEPSDEIAFIVGSGHSVAIPEKMKRYGIRYNVCIVKPQAGDLRSDFYNKGMLGMLNLTDTEAIGALGVDSTR